MNPLPSAARLAPACLLALLLAWTGATAQTPVEKVYVTRDFKAGLHEEKSLDSAITTLVSSGAALDVIKREDNLSFVRTPDGATGWIDNSYLVAEPPTDAAELKRMRERADALERRLNEANQRLQAGAAGAAAAVPPAASELAARVDELEQELKSERLRSGELQVQLTELRKRADMSGDENALFERVEQLEAENRKLRLAIPGGGPPPGVEPAATGFAMQRKHVLAVGVLLLVIGLGGGMYMMDYLNRRRHGGFRI